jgi:serine phosphatase RsbU (regulator of sigma subunit)
MQTAPFHLSPQQLASNARAKLASAWQEEYHRIGALNVKIAAWIIIFSYPASIFPNLADVDANLLPIYIAVYVAPSIIVALTLLLWRFVPMRHEIVTFVLVASVFTAATYRIHNPEMLLLVYLITNAVCFIASAVQIFVKPPIVVGYALYIFIINLAVSYYGYGWSVADYFLIGGGVVILTMDAVFVGVVIVRYHSAKKNFLNSLALQASYEQLAAQNQVIEEKSKIIQENNNNITASINYARRIQQAILPTQKRIQEGLPEHFVFFRPKDIVSGDFYWFGEIEPQPIYRQQNLTAGQTASVLEGFTSPKSIIAALDCTGHGVPGAFMSMLIHAYLNNIIHERNIHSPDQILAAVHEALLESLNPNETDTHDGMDAAICVYDSENQTLYFSGAKNPLFWVALDGQLTEIPAGRFAVGGSQLDIQPKYDLHTLPITEPTMCYIFSDGFASQFGGSEGRKFMRKRLAQLLAQNAQLEVDTQRRHLEAAFDEWTAHGLYPQVDDVLVIGFRLKPQ